MSEVTVKINNKDVSVEDGSTILDAARKAGFDIPTFCHSENLKPFTSCFICAVKVEGGRGNLVPSCSTKVRDGMAVTVESEEVDAARRMALNLMLSDHCGDCLPPCEDACPASIDIKGFMGLVAEGRELDAAKLIREKAPIGGALGRICPRPCEDACRRNRVEEAMSICSMKRYISDSEYRELQGKRDLPAPGADTGKKVAIIGAGPAGMTAAYFLRLQGHAVTVFEAHKKSGGMLRYGIPYYRLPDVVLNDQFGNIENLGVEVRYNTKVGEDISLKAIESEYDSLIVAVGAQSASSARVPGEDLEGVYAGIDYLASLADHCQPDIGNKVVVIGGGNTAIDAARSALREGADVTILYRRTRAEMPASEWEIDEALEEGVKIQYLAAPTLIEKDGNGLSVECIKMELGEADASGRRRPVPVEGSEYKINVDSVITAIGQKVDAVFVNEAGIELTRWGTVLSDNKTFMTNRPGVFACGDCQTGADIAVKAVGAGRKTAVSVDQFLKGEEVKGEPVLFNSRMGELNDVSEKLFEGVEECPRVEMPIISEAKRVSSFEEVETGFSVEEARKEAARCLQCGCDAANDCKLRDYATRYGADQNYFGGERREFEVDKSHELVKMEFSKCINCGSCVRACAEIKGLDVLAYVDRGFVTRMKAPFGRSLVDTACDGCGECVKVCPTGAIVMKKEAQPV
ncbi:MAG: FAD-dependent oxidoreductase [Spirochaetales bacterium]|uniref:FAD-dependent oxidoreductase n=1 Tax=Candidatus Thalassospirochaeta sargassi TaxID=3119039 RepID=A0AAJ1IHC7_9SPIO|nr:FAD-dependent oxidoreductase [Spirochaetales bacterium]